MIDADSEALRFDPGKIALGDTGPAVLEQAMNQPEGAACQASLSAFRSALFFKNLFTGLVACLAGITLVALSYCVFRVVMTPPWDTTNTFAVIGAAVTGAGGAYLGTQRTKANNVLTTALGDVGKYCGTPKEQEIQG